MEFLHDKGGHGPLLSTLSSASAQDDPLIHEVLGWKWAGPTISWKHIREWRSTCIFSFSYLPGYRRCAAFFVQCFNIFLRDCTSATSAAIRCSLPHNACTSANSELHSWEAVATSGSVAPTRTQPAQPLQSRRGKSSAPLSTAGLGVKPLPRAPDGCI